MNKIIITMAAITGIGFAACAQDRGGNSMQIENKPLVVYFSATGTTAKQPVQSQMLREAHSMRLNRSMPTRRMTLIGMTDSRAAPLR